MDKYGIFQAPLSQNYYHGLWLMEEENFKSDGKPQTADSYVTKYGADVLRHGYARKIFAEISLCPMKYWIKQSDHIVH